ncbi:hypothetical protein [Shouchella miscanthi]|uniref:hypothetical protein n=1 Tax=Shouchella miscanthi TaxID=2598861 RepID=UPI0011A804ED|nr:hypothetical protein [Shouchella miscanthi]
MPDNLESEAKTYLVVLAHTAFSIKVIEFEHVHDYLLDTFELNEIEEMSIINVSKQGILLNLNVPDTNEMIKRIRSLMKGENRMLLNNN